MAQNPSSSKRPTPGAARGRSPLTPFYLILAVVALAGVGVLLYPLLGMPAPASAPVAVTLDPAELARVQGISMGRADAPVVIYEFADFQCPGCAHFATNVSRPIRAQYVDSGQVRFEYYDMPLYQIHPHAFLAARAARCAGDQNLFWEMHDMLYARQQEWAIDRTPPIARYAGYAESIGADRGDFEACLQSDAHAETVTANGMLGQQLGVGSTPTVYINGRNVGEAWSDFEAMSELIEEALANAPARTPGVATDTAMSDTASAR